MRIILFSLGAVLALSTVAHATETVTYTYDAKGRVVTVVHSGTVNNGVSTSYSSDKADNRTQAATTGASH